VVPKQYHLQVNGRSYVVEVESPVTSPAVVRVNGRAFEIPWRAEHEGAAASTEALPRVAHHGDPSLDQLAAPMPGTVLDIAVQPGDVVAFQQELCKLEAMKMKNSIRSPRSGRIATVNVTDGQTVVYGDVLFVFE
jgi:glutaconyl-CoA/methylmalonyl-CoA decarboxylase subunit gamma